MHFPFALPFGSIDDDLCAVSITVRVCGALCTTFSGRTPSLLVVRLPLQHVNVLVPDSSCQRLHILLFFFLLRTIFVSLSLDLPTQTSRIWFHRSIHVTSMTVYLPLASIGWPVGNEMCPCLHDCRNAVHGWEDEKHRHATCGYNSFPISFAFRFSSVPLSLRSTRLAECAYVCSVKIIIIIIKIHL